MLNKLSFWVITRTVTFPSAARPIAALQSHHKTEAWTSIRTCVLPQICKSTEEKQGDWSAGHYWTRAEGLRSAEEDHLPGNRVTCKFWRLAGGSKVAQRVLCELNCGSIMYGNNNNDNCQRWSLIAQTNQMIRVLDDVGRRMSSSLVCYKLQCDRWTVSWF